MMQRAVAIGFVLVLGLVPLVATAQEGDSSDGRLLLIMDASGSMNEVDDGGVSLIEGAKQALRVLVSALPDGAEVGLRVYGHRVANTDRTNGCLDTELVIPVGPIDREEMRSAIDAYEAKGFTPIGLSLQEAADDLEGDGTIVLVSDGIDTCAPPDPCEVAADLAERGLGLIVHTVGLHLDDPAAEQQLQCIADATGGSYSRADSITDLVGDLTGLATEALGEGSATPVLLGALDRLQAPVVALGSVDDPNWQALSGGVSGTISAGETRWYALEVPQEGAWQVVADARLHIPLESAPDGYLEMQVYDPDGEPIGVPHSVLGVVVELPQRIRLQDASDWVPPGDPIGVRAVTDPHSAPPGWPGTESDDPYMAWMTDRLTARGLNRGLYELWQNDAGATGLEPGRYFLGVTLVSKQAFDAEMELGVILNPTPDGTNVRTRAGEPDLLIDPASDQLELLELGSWTGGDVDGSTPVRSGEAWTLLPADGVRLGVDLQEGEMLGVGFAMGPVFIPNPGSLELALRDTDGNLVQLLGDPEDDVLSIPGYEGRVYRWEVPEDGRFELSARPVQVQEPADAAAVLAAFAFAPEPVATTEAPEATDAPEPPDLPVPPQAATPERENAEFPIFSVALVGGAVVILAGLSIWWLWRRRAS